MCARPFVAGDRLCKILPGHFVAPGNSNARKNDSPINCKLKSKEVEQKRGFLGGAAG
jgi:hypothetical protein